MGPLDRDPLKFSKQVVSSAQNFDRISIAGFIVLAQLFVFLSAPRLWPDEAVQNMVLVYFVMLAFSFAMLDLESPLYKISIWDGLVQYVVAFVVGLFLFEKIGLGAGTADYGGFGSLTLLVIAEVFVVSLSEEIMFRGGLPAALQRSRVPLVQAVFLSNLAFSFFHVWAYSWSVPQLFAAFCFGLIMSYFWYGGSFDSQKGSGYPLVSCGLHGAWNVMVLGGPFTIFSGGLL